MDDIGIGFTLFVFLSAVVIEPSFNVLFSQSLFLLLYFFESKIKQHTEARFFTYARLFGPVCFRSKRKMLCKT